MQKSLLHGFPVLLLVFALFSCGCFTVSSRGLVFISGFNGVDEVNHTATTYRGTGN